MYDEFFTNDDKPYAENLNDSLILVDAFNLTVPCELPTMFSNGAFSDELNIMRKAGICIVTLISKDDGISIESNVISGTGKIVYRVYPNFNSFYKWNRISLEKTGEVSIIFKKTDGIVINSTISSNGQITESSALKTLQEIDVELTLENANINSILFEFVNNQTTRARSQAKLDASQLTNVNGKIGPGEAQAVNGDAVHTALNEISKEVNEELSEKSDIGHNHSITQITDLGFVSTTENGLMSKEDKTKLDSVNFGANKTEVDSSLSDISINPVQNKIITTEINNLNQNKLDASSIVEKEMVVTYKDGTSETFKVLTK